MKRLAQVELGEYLAIDTEGETILGPAKSMKELETLLIKDAEHLFSQSGEMVIGENEDWGSPIIIVQAIKKVRQVPVVNVSVKLKPAK